MSPCKALTRRDVPLPKLSTGVVVRPRTGSSCALGGRDIGGIATTHQILVFLGDEIRELLPSGGAAAGAAAQQDASRTHNAGPESFKLSTQRLAVTGQELRKARHPVYEPTTNVVFFIEGYTIKRLDATNTVSLVAGSELENGRVDGATGVARFNAIHSLAADGKGRLFVAEALSIRILDVSTGKVTTLPGSEPAEAYWTSIAYDTKHDVLVVATPVAVCHVTLPPPAPPGGVDMGGGSGAGHASCVTAAKVKPRIVAGSWVEHGNADGDGTAARFWAIWSVLAAADGVVHIGDCSRLCSLDGSGAVTTRLTGAVEGYTLRQMAILPGGQLAVDDFFKQVLVIISCGDGGAAGSDFQPCSEALAGRVTTAAVAAGVSSTDSAGSSEAPRQQAAVASGLLDFLLASPQHSGSSGGQGAGATDTTAAARSATTASTVTITTRGGRGFVGHRSVLAARSEYFKCLLAAAEESRGADSGDTDDGGVSNGGGIEVLLPDADPEAFGRLLVYMYTGELVVPDELLHPVAALARRLKLPAECSAQLAARLLEGVNPGSVVSELVWAERHGLTEVAAQLQTQLMQRRREVAAAGPEARNGVSELIAVHPELTAEVMLQLLAT